MEKAEVDARIASIEDALVRERSLFEEDLDEPLDFAFAKELHRGGCPLNHDTLCTWYKEVSWADPVHALYLRRSRNAIKLQDFIERIQKAIKRFRQRWS